MDITPHDENCGCPTHLAQREAHARRALGMVESATRYVPVTSLSRPLRLALREVDFHREAIGVEVAAAVSMWEPADDNRRGFVMLVRLDTGGRELHEGSFGGWPEDASRPGPVDADRRKRRIPDHGVVIKGSRGYGGTSATIYMPPAQAAAFLPAARVELTDDERNALYCHEAIKGGQYRRDELARRRVPDGVVDGLVARGLLSRNAAGAVRITVEGRNALGGWNGF